MAHKLFIGGLPFSTSSERLREVFAQAGGVESATVVMEQDTGRSRGFGFVEMATAEEADTAVKKFNDQAMDGRTLKVEIARAVAGTGAAVAGVATRQASRRAGVGAASRRPASADPFSDQLRGGARDVGVVEPRDWFSSVSS